MNGFVIFNLGFAIINVVMYTQNQDGGQLGFAGLSLFVAAVCYNKEK